MATGHVERLKSGAYRATVYAGKDPITGKKVYLKETYADQLHAEQARARLLSQVEAESHPDRAATVSTLLDRWAEVVDHGINTRATTEVYVRRVIRPALGDMPLRKLQHRVDILDRMYTHLRRCSSLCDGRPYVEHKRPGDHECEAQGCKPHACRPMAPATVRRVHAILSSSLSYAVSWGWMERNPAEHAHPPKLKRRRARPPEAEQVARLLNLAWQTDVELAMFLWLATTLGTRRGELAALRWSYIDLRSAIVRIETAYVVRAGERALKETKTDADRRLSLDTLTVQMLKDFRQQREEALAPARLTLDPDAFVFTPDPAGKRPWHPDHYTHAYRELANVLDIAEPLKNLRHFNATQLLAAGVDLRTTAGRLGHSDGGATTLKVYADWMPAVDRTAAEQLSTDLAALRAAARRAEPAGARSAAAVLPQTSRPLSEILTHPAEGPSTYLEISAGLRTAINSLALAPGVAIPTVAELALWFGVARSTAQRAVSLLGKEGLIARAGARWIVTTSSGP